jgi:hypothetical protein
MQPGLGVITTDSAPCYPNLLADDDYEILNAMLEDYNHNDFRYTGLVANSVWPAGALLGWPATMTGANTQRALNAGGVLSDTVVLFLYVWSLAGMALRGRLSNENVPASWYNHTVVLAKDVDTNDGGNPALDYLVPIFWRASFKPTGIIQDTTSYGATPWPGVDGTPGRISIVPGLR